MFQVYHSQTSLPQRANGAEATPKEAAEAINLSKELADFLTKSACDRVQGVGRGSTRKGSCNMVLWRLMTAKTSPKRKPTWPSKFAIYGLQLGTHFGKVLATLRRHRTFFWCPMLDPQFQPPQYGHKQFK